MRSRISYTIGNCSVSLDDKNTVHVVSIGDTTDDQADQVYEAHRKLLAVTTGLLFVLVDLNGAGKSSPYARRIWKKMSEHERVAKVALYGVHPVAWVLSSFLVGRTTRNNTGFFKTKEQARRWFNE